LLELSESLLGMSPITPERILPITSIPTVRAALMPSTNAVSEVKNVVY